VNRYPQSPVILETIEQLDKQKVSDRQICLIYGWVEPDGTTPQFSKLREERAKPGKHTGPDSGFVPPVEKARQKEFKRQNAIIERIRQKQALKIRK